MQIKPIRISMLYGRLMCRYTETSFPKNNRWRWQNNVEECFARDPIDVQMYVQLFGGGDLSGSLHMDFYGRAEYPDVQERIHGDYADCSGESAHADTVFEIANLCRLDKWAISGVDRRNGQLPKYIASAQIFGVAHDEYTDVYPHGMIGGGKQCM